MSSSISIDRLGELGKQAQALGVSAKAAINKALLSGAKVIAAEASVRIPRTAHHRTDNGRSAKHLADALKAEIITDRQVAGVTVEGDFNNGPSYYVKFVEYGTTRMKARRYIESSAAAKENEALAQIAAVLKDKLGL